MHRALCVVTAITLSGCFPETRKEDEVGDAPTREPRDGDADGDSDTGIGDAPDTDSAPDTDTDTDTDTDAEQNEAPSAPEVSISPSSPTDSDDLTCVIETESADPDGDEISYTYTWWVDGADAGVSSDTVRDSMTNVGETWRCSVTASDGELTATSSKASATIAEDPIPFEDYTTEVGSEMIAIPAGTFWMGSSSYGPIHSVTLTHDFWIGQTEVTQGQYEELVGSNPSSFDGCGADCPVESIPWEDMALYANALSEAEGLESCYTTYGTDLAASLGGDPYACEGYRLPTEAEWEYAARADDATTYAGSDSPGEVAWYSSNSSGRTHPVAEKEANGWGLYDMSGNVYEFTGDLYGDYSADVATDPVGASSGSARVFRGGSYFDTASMAAVSARLRESPVGGAWTDGGFRLVRTYVSP